MAGKQLIASALAALAIVAAADSAMAQRQTAYQRGMQIGLSRGYAPGQLECYAQIFARRATIGPKATRINKCFV